MNHGEPSKGDPSIRNRAGVPMYRRAPGRPEVSARCNSIAHR
jgi:hypothetical protein